MRASKAEPNMAKIKTDDTITGKRSFTANMIVIMPKRKGKVVK